MRSPRTTRGNRITLGIVGVILIAGGLFVLGQSQNLFFRASANQSLLIRSESHFAHSHTWIWVIAATVGGLVALLCLRWLLVQLRREEIRAFRLEPDRTRGGTKIAATLLTGAIEDDISTFGDVSRVHAHITGAARQPVLKLHIAIDPRADIARLRWRVETEAIPRFRQALELDELPTRLILQQGR